MQQKNPAENFFGDMQATLKDMANATPTGFPFDFKAIMEMQRKNIQAITEANQRTLQGWQALVQRQTEMVTQFVQDNSGITSETFSEKSPEAKFAKQTEILKSTYEKSIKNSQELAEIARQCTEEASDLISQRIMASLAEIKDSTKNSGKK